MAVRDERIDAYIAAQADFARPILMLIRERVHAASPDVGEALKWSMPFFTYGDKNLCNMAAFKAHAAFGFWHDKVMAKDKDGSAMGQFGKLESIADLPSEAEMASLLGQAIALIDRGVKVRAPVQKRPDLPVPPAFTAAIEADPMAGAQWSAFPVGKRRDYIEWVNDAKQEAIRDRRIAQAVEWIAEGKSRTWKYERR